MGCQPFPYEGAQQDQIVPNQAFVQPGKIQKMFRKLLGNNEQEQGRIRSEDE
jgi:hypothetical protein